MADANTCQQCGAVKQVRQSKGRLVCFPCYDNEHPEEKIIMSGIEEDKKPPISDKLFLHTAAHAFKIGDEYIIPKEKKDESIPSSQTQKEKGTLRSGVRRLQR